MLKKLFGLRKRMHKGEGQQRPVILSQPPPCTFSFEGPNAALMVSAEDAQELLELLNSLVKTRAIAKLLNGEE